MGTFQTVELIETFINYHENIKKCVCIIYDPQRSSRGSVALKAIRLKESFIELSKEQKLTLKGFREANLSWRDIFVELPIKIRNSNLVQALVADLAPATTATQADVERLNLSVAPFLEKNIQSLIECVDDIVQEQSKVRKEDGDEEGGERGCRFKLSTCPGRGGRAIACDLRWHSSCACRSNGHVACLLLVPFCSSVPALRACACAGDPVPQERGAAAAGIRGVAGQAAAGEHAAPAGERLSGWC